jgi:hypothetical protein
MFSIKGKCVYLYVVLIASILCLAGSLPAADSGSIVGFVFGPDGTTPLEGAVVVAKNLATGKVYESTKSDSVGLFKLPEIEKGIYIYGVRTDQGEFNAGSPMGVTIEPNETAKLSISVSPLPKDAAASMPGVYEEQKIKGEALVGKVVSYSVQDKLSVVYVAKGFLEEGQRIHVKSARTNFYQDIKGIKGMAPGSKRVASGETGALPLAKQALPGDEIYLVRRTHAPLFLAPLGVATIVAGSAGIITAVTDPSAKSQGVSVHK